MKTHLKLLLCILSLLLTTGCKQKAHEPTQEATATAEAQAEPFGIIEEADLDGNKIAPINEIARHQYTVIDFWASWCGPCRMAMPYVKQLYALLKDKGLGIVGISLDNDYEAWKKAVEEENTEWLQLSELKGWDDTYARKYEVNAIPCFLVVDRQGKILHQHLSIQELFDVLPPLFSEELAPAEDASL